MRLIILLLCAISLSNCALLVAKETAKVVDIVLEGEVNPDKKRKILEKQNSRKKSNRSKAKEFYCNKVKDKEKCND